MGFFINASKSKKRQRVIFLVTALFLAAGLVGSTMVGIFGGQPENNYVDAASGPPGIEELEEQLKENPGDLDTLRRLAEAYYNDGRTGKSLETYRKALEIDPGNSDLRISLAVTCFLADKYDEAIAEINKEIEQNPDNKIARYYLGQFLAYGKGDYEQAIIELQRFVDEAGAGELDTEVAKARQMIEELKNRKG